MALSAASRACTVTLNAVPAVLLAGAVTVKCVAGPVLTVTVALPVMVLVTVSVALMLLGPSDASETPLKVCTPPSPAVKM